MRLRNLIVLGMFAVITTGMFTSCSQKTEETTVTDTTATMTPAPEPAPAPAPAPTMDTTVTIDSTHKH
jgi:hypothetical protein